MAVCPSGHDSASDDFCDVCGIRIGGAAAATPEAPAAPASPAAGSAAGECPNCGAPRSGQFCEACGLDFSSGRLPEGSAAMPAQPVTATAPAPAPVETPAPPETSIPSQASALDAPVPAETPAPAATALGDWTAVVAADRMYYDSVQAQSGPEAAAIRFPAYCAERRFRLAGAEVRIGRHSASRGLDPEIDLTGPPADPGVSRLHAVLMATPDGGWAVLDPGSANGTLVNGTEIPPGEQVPLRDGDRINLGAWTVITIQHA